MFRLTAIATVLFAFSCGVGESEVTTSDETATADQELRQKACMTVRCAAGYHCVAHGQRAGCEADTCQTAADCRLDDNYCDGCACEARLANAPAPVCNGTLVSCFAQPCASKTAACQSGKCVVASAPVGIKCGAKTCGSGDYCCNASCGICAPRGAMCIQIACAAP